VDFTLRNLPASVLNELEHAARRNGRSVNDEAIARLSGERRPASPNVTAELDEIDRVRASLSVPRLTGEYFERAIDRGRP
jgi:plasmid stability protein